MVAKCFLSVDARYYRVDNWHFRVQISLIWHLIDLKSIFDSKTFGLAVWNFLALSHKFGNRRD